MTSQPTQTNSHTTICAEIIYEVLAEANRTYENIKVPEAPHLIWPSPTREDYVSDVIRHLQTQLDSGFWAEAGR